MEYKELNFITPEKPIGCGSTAVCYLIEGNKVFKEFVPKQSIIMKEKYEQFQNIKNRGFKFPLDFVYDDKYLYGYVMDYVKGSTLDKVFKDTNLIDLSTHSIAFENDIKELSKEHILLNDMNGSNIMYDNSKITAIDSDVYRIQKDTDLEKDNLFSYKIALNSIIFMNLNRFKNADLVAERLRKEAYIKDSASIMLLTFLDDLRAVYHDQNIKSMSDIDPSFIRGR